MLIAIFFVLLGVVVIIYAIRVSRKTTRKDFLDKPTDADNDDPPSHSPLR